MRARARAPSRPRPHTLLGRRRTWTRRLGRLGELRSPWPTQIPPAGVGGVPCARCPNNTSQTARRSRSWVPAGCTCTPTVRCSLSVPHTHPDELASAASFVRGETCRFEASLGRRWWRRTPLLAFARSTQSTVLSGTLSVQPSARGMTSRDACAFGSPTKSARAREGVLVVAGALAPTNSSARDRAGILRGAGGVGRPLDTPKETTYGAAGAEPTSILCASALG